MQEKLLGRGEDATGGVDLKGQKWTLPLFIFFSAILVIKQKYSVLCVYWKEVQKYTVPYANEQKT